MNQLKAGAILNYVIIVLNALVGLLYTPYMLRCLGQSEYGLYSLVASIIAYLTLLDFGFGPTVVRYAAKYIAEGKIREQYSLYGLFFRLYTIIGIIAFVAGLALYFNINWLFDKTMTETELSQARIMILLLLINLTITFPMSVFGSIINAYERFVFQKIITIGRILLSTAVLLIVLKMGYKAVALVIVQTIFNVGLLSINYYYCREKLKIKLIFEKFNWTFVREIINFSIWVFLGDVMFKFYYSTGQFVLGATSGTSAVAVFALGVTLMQMYIMFSSGISGVLLPRVTSMVAQNKSDDEISELFIRTGRLQFIIMSFILTGYIIIGKSFITLWAGSNYNMVYYIALVFFLSTITPLIQNTGIAILLARNQQKYRSVLLVSMGAISLIGQIILAKYYSALGCAIAVAIANIIGQGVILNHYYYKKQRINIIKFWKEIIRMSIFPLVFSIIGYIIISKYQINTWIKLIECFLIISITYIPLFWKLSMNKYERELMSETISKIRNLIHR